LVDAVDEPRVGLDEVGSRLLRIFELADPSGEPGPLAFEKPNVRFGRALPGTLGHLEHCGTGPNVVAASVPGEEPLTAGMLDVTGVVLVDSARDLQVLVTFSDGSTGPPPGAGAEIGKVLFERGVLLVDVSKLVGVEGWDARNELSVLGAYLGKALRGSGSRPLLATLVIPGPGETLCGLNKVGRGGVDVARVPGPAHGHIGELPATAVVEDVGNFDRGALGAMTSDGVAVAETVGTDVISAHVQLSAVGCDRCEGLGLRVDGGDLCGLRGDPGALRSGCKGDDPVTGPVGTPSESGELGACEPPGALPEVSSSAVERLDVVATVGDEERVPSGVDVGRPGPDHPDHRPPAVGYGMDSPVAGIPADGGEVAVTELGERGTFGGVGLAQVVGERPRAAQDGVRRER
jgi:hypothetical protein